EQLMQIFGQRFAGVQAIIEQGTDSLANFTKELETSGGTAQRVAETQMEGFAGAFVRFKSVLETLMITIARSGLLETLTELAEKAANFLDRLSKTNPELFRMATIAAAVVAAIGPVIWILGSLAQSVGAIILVFGKLAGAATFLAT